MGLGGQLNYLKQIVAVKGEHRVYENVKSEAQMEHTALKYLKAGYTITLENR